MLDVPNAAFLTLARGFFSLALASSIAAQAGLPTATPAAAGVDPDQLSAAAARVRAEVAADRMRGAVLLVARHGKVVLHEAFGHRDAAGRVPMRCDTQFRMASNTKPLTATAVLMLVEQGKLELDAKVGDYLPAWRKGATGAITVRQLLTHTSGLRIPTLFLRPLMRRSPAHPKAPTLQLEVDRFATVGPEEKPGTTYSYSNPGYNTLAALVEVASGLPFATFLKRHVYDRLGMPDSGHRESAADAERMSAVFRRVRGRWRVRWRPADGNDLPFVRGSGGMVSTTADYSRFCHCLLRGGALDGVRLLRRETVREMTRRQLHRIPAARRYGLGWAIPDDSGTFVHGGSDGTWAAVDPALGLVVLVFTQTQGVRGAVRRRFLRDVRRAILPRERPNVLLITADDLNCDSVGVFGCPLPGITPHIDALAAAGMRFTRAHVNIAVCQPCRAVLMTGRYPHRNGARGFEPIAAGVPTLTGVLAKHGYLNGILGKTRHLAPPAAFAWDVVVTRRALGEGRDPERYAASARAFFRRAKRSAKPFFLMANCHDPHRPFAGSAQERRQRQRRKKAFPIAARRFAAREVPVPGFLPGLPAVRRELAQYFTSVHRCDRIVGRVLAELDAAGLAANTIVCFLSDHGMPLPFAKTNCYRHSTRTPWIVRWPGRVRPGSVEGTHFVSTIDWLPTVLQALGLPAVAGVDGRSFLPLLRGETQLGRDHVLTSFYKTSGKRDFPMRSLVTARYGYIVNAWADGDTRFRNESQNGLTWRAMRRAAATDPAIAARVKHFAFRCREELYDYSVDPHALRNLAIDPAHRSILHRMRRRLAEELRKTRDPEAAKFRIRQVR